MLWMLGNVLCSLQYFRFSPSFSILGLVGRPLAEAGWQLVKKSVLFSENIKSPNVSVISVCTVCTCESVEESNFPPSKVKSNYAYLFRRTNVPPSSFLWG